MLKNKYLTLILLIIACSPKVFEKTLILREYEETKKQAFEEKKSYSVSFTDIVLAPQTVQSQTKGSVTISCEIVPNNLKKTSKTELLPQASKPNDKGKIDYDNFEELKYNSYAQEYKNTRFNIRIRNSSDKMLELKKVAWRFTVDGKEYSIAREAVNGWENGFIFNDDEKSYLFNGPEISSLSDVKIIKIELVNVPTEFAANGDVNTTNNFQWFFLLQKGEKKVEDIIYHTFITKPVYKENCNTCENKGVIIQNESCKSCSGKGTKYNLLTNVTYTCNNCKGVGKANYSYTCSKCDGEGFNRYPKSEPAKLTQEKVYNYFTVAIKTKPGGLKVMVYNPQSGANKYDESGFSPGNVNFIYTNEDIKPIKIKYNNKEYGFLPYDAHGSKTSIISVDFTKGVPVVLKGTMSN